MTRASPTRAAGSLPSSTRIEQRYDRASGELAERMRLSEERTAALIAEARENIDRRAEPAKAVPAADAQPDWRAARNDYIVVGRVEELAYGDGREDASAVDAPLLFHRGAYTQPE